jgi:hypothetical protein
MLGGADPDVASLIRATLAGQDRLPTYSSISRAILWAAGDDVPPALFARADEVIE